MSENEYGNSSSGGAPELLQARIKEQLKEQVQAVANPGVLEESNAGELPPPPPPPAPPTAESIVIGSEELSELEVMPDAELVALAKAHNVVVENVGDRSSVLAALLAAGIKSATSQPNPVPPAPPSLAFTFGPTKTEA